MGKVYCGDCRYYKGIEAYLEPDLHLAECKIPRERTMSLNWLEKDGESFTISDKEVHYCAIQNKKNDCELFISKKPPQQKPKTRKSIMEFLRGGV